MKSQFSDLFANDYAIHKMPVNAFPVPSWRFRLSDDECKLLPPGMIGIDFEYERIPLPIRNSIVATFNKLVPSNRVTNCVNEFAERFDENTVSVHIRTWTTLRGRGDRWRRKLFNMAAFTKAMDMQDGKFYVAADSPEPVKKLRKRYGKRIIHRPARPGFSAKANVDSLIDLLLLSKNRTIINTVYPPSSYSEMAWWLSGCEAKVIKILFPGK